MESVVFVFLFASMKRADPEVQHKSTSKHSIIRTISTCGDTGETQIMVIRRKKKKAMSGLTVLS